LYLTKIVVEGTLLLDGVRVTEEPKPVPVVVETSKSVGAVTIKSVVKSVPETVYVCSADVDPTATLPKLREPPVVAMVGGATA
jgi:hypothetical protein